MARPQDAPIIVLGNQKSGTSAIAALLADASGLPATLDFRRLIGEPQLQASLYSGDLPFASFVRRYAFEFSRRIIKEPALTFFADQLVEHFPRAAFVFVVRDPRDNIRSLLNRLGLPGHLDDAVEMRRLASAQPRAWRMTLSSEWLDIDAPDYIEALARRWNLAAQCYLRHDQKFILARYEDFVTAKRDFIVSMANRLGLTTAPDVILDVDRQFQRTGDRGVRWGEFFGASNLGRIERLGAEGMRAFGYAATEETR